MAKKVEHTGRTTTATPTDPGWTHRLNVAGVDYFLDVRAISALDDAALQKGSQGVITAAQVVEPGPAGFSLVNMAAIIWLSRRQHGDRKVSFLEVAGQLKMGDVKEADLEVRDPDEEDSDPEG